MTRTILQVFLTLVIGLAVGANAQNLNIETADQSVSFDDPGKPTRGMSRDRVQAYFGMPKSRRNPVGDPPITRWDYANFVVFFEYDKVIHSVSKR